MERLPSGEKETELTQSRWLCSVTTSLPVASSNTLVGLPGAISHLLAGEKDQFGDGNAMR
jgi:hypothetical protein